VTAIPVVLVPVWIVSAVTLVIVTRATKEITASTKLTNAKDIVPASMECAQMVKPTIFAIVNRNTVAKIAR